MATRKGSAAGATDAEAEETVAEEDKVPAEVDDEDNDDEEEEAAEDAEDGADETTRANCVAGVTRTASPQSAHQRASADASSSSSARSRSPRSSLTPMWPAANRG